MNKRNKFYIAYTFIIYVQQKIKILSNSSENKSLSKKEFCFRTNVRKHSFVPNEFKKTKGF